MQPTDQEQSEIDIRKRLEELELENTQLKADKHDLNNRIANKNNIIRQKENDIAALKTSKQVYNLQI